MGCDHADLQPRQRFAFMDGKGQIAQYLAWVVITRSRIDDRGFGSDGKLDTRNNRDFGRAMIRSVFDEVSVGI